VLLRPANANAGSGGRASGPDARAGQGGQAGSGGAEPASDVISVEDGDFQMGGAPDVSEPEALPAITSLTGPAAVTNGGLAILHVQLASPVDAPSFLVSLVGDMGYHTVPGTDPDADGTYDISVQVSGDATQGSLVLRVALTDGMGNVGEYRELEVELVQSGSGDVKITLSFDRVHDLDLHVVEPNGEEIFFENNASATGGQLDLDSGEHCQPSAANSENIFWPPGEAPTGEYRISVVNYEHCTPGPIEFSVRIAYDSSIETFRGSFPDGSLGSRVDVGTFSR
jgi:hypothetical protein